MVRYSAFEAYVAWCLDHGQKPPTREWWDWACSRDREVPRLVRRLEYAEQDAFQAEIDRERREGWAYD